MYRRAQLLISFLIGVLITYGAFITPLYANPQGAAVVAGQVSLNQPDAKTLQINQGSDKAIINWQSFNIAADEHTRIQQPTNNSVLLNRVVGGDVSKIFGQLSANGKIVLINPAGIYFSPTARVNVASIIATTANITDENFLKDNYHFIQTPGNNNSVVNEGEIKAASGLVALVAPGVVNSGVIEAQLGKVALASGNEFTIDLYGDHIINFAVNNKVTQAAKDHDGNTLDAAVTNKGNIIADGGKILITANVAQNVVQNVINMQGVAQANAVVQRGGEIILLGGETGKVNVAGKLIANGKNQNQQGGKIKVLAKQVELAPTAELDATGYAGGGEILIGGNYQGKGPGPNALTTTVRAGAVINASALYQGNGGKIIIWSDDNTQYAGALLARGGEAGGNGGFAEVSGKRLLSFKGTTDLRAPLGNKGSLLLDPRNLVIDSSAAIGVTTATAYGSPVNTYVAEDNDTSYLTTEDLVAALNNADVTIQTDSSGDAAGNIRINSSFTWTNDNSLTLLAANDIIVDGVITNTGGGELILRADAFSTGTGTVMFGAGWITFSGGGDVKIQYNPSSYGSPTNYSSKITIYGDACTTCGYMLVHNVTQLQSIKNYANGVFALSQNIDASSTASWNSGAGFIPIGGDPVTDFFSGVFDGNGYIINGLTINRPTTDYVGLFGVIGGGTVKNVGLTNANIIGQDYVGAIAGANSQASLTIKNSFSTGTVSGRDYVGGIAGSNQLASTISNTFSSATVTGRNKVGGLLGQNGNSDFEDTDNSVFNSYSTGVVTGSSYVGGLIGYTHSGNAVLNSYWNTETSGLSTSPGGGEGKTTAQLKQQATFEDWDFTTLWGISENNNTPYLRALAQITGTVTDANGNTVSNARVIAVANGSVIGTIQANSSGVYIFRSNQLAGPLANGVLLYNKAATAPGAAVTTFDGFNQNAVNIADNNLLIYGDNNYSASNTLLANTLGNLANAIMPYTFSGNNIQMKSGVAWRQMTGNYNINGNITGNNAGIIFNGAVLLSANVTLSNINGSLTFNNTLDGNQNLTLNINNGNIQFNNNVGATNRLNNLTIQQANNVNLASGKTLYTTNFTQAVGVGTSNFGSNSLNATGAVNVNANSIQGHIISNNVTLVGNQFYTATITSSSLTGSSLTLGGNNGATITWQIAGQPDYLIALQASLLSGASGNFTVNGFPVLANAARTTFDQVAYNLVEQDNTDIYIGSDSLAQNTEDNMIEINGDNFAVLAASGICQ